MDREEIKKLVKMWWDLYNDVTLDYNYNGASEADVAVPELKYSRAPSAA
jgi:hypothetical protein